jgi:hypothetical protein
VTDSDAGVREISRIVVRLQRPGGSSSSEPGQGYRVMGPEEAPKPRLFVVRIWDDAGTWVQHRDIFARANAGISPGDFRVIRSTVGRPPRNSEHARFVVLEVTGESLRTLVRMEYLLWGSVLTGRPYFLEIRGGNGNQIEEANLDQLVTDTVASMSITEDDSAEGGSQGKEDSSG